MNIEVAKAPLRQIYAPPDELVPAVRPELSEIFAAAFRRENIVGSFIANMDTFAKSYTDEEGYDAFEGNEGTIFEKYPDALIGIGSPEEKADLQAKLEREQQDLETLSHAGFMGWGAAIAAGLLDPLVLIPFGGAAGAMRMGVKAARLARMSAPLRGGIRTARAAVLGATASEVALQTQQETRTWGESAANIGAAAFLSGVMGGLLGSMDEALTQAAIRDVRRQLGVVAGGSGKAVKGAALANTKVVDAAGDLRTVYHGSATPGMTLQKLDPRRGIEAEGVTFFTSNEEIAEQFVYPREYGEIVTERPTGRYELDEFGDEMEIFEEIEPGPILEAHLNIENPLVVRGAEAQRGIDDTAFQMELVRRAKEGGHDGLIFEDVTEFQDTRARGDVYGVFEAKQIHPARRAGPVAGGRGEEIVDDPNVVQISADEVRADSAGKGKNLEIKLKRNFGAARAMAAVRLSPFIRLMVRSRSNKLKETLLHLTDAPCIVEGWSPSISVFQKTQKWDVVISQLREAKAAAFVEYRQRMTGMKAKGAVGRWKARADDALHKSDMLEKGVLNETEFDLEIGRAMWSGDKSPIPEVERMAERYRAELFDPILERAIELKLLPKEIAEKGVVGARSYLSRMPIKNNIIAYRDKFRLRIKDYFREILTDEDIDRITRKHEGLSHEEALDIELDRQTEDAIDQIIGWSDARMLIEPVKAPSPSPFKDRTLAIDDDVLRAPIPDGNGGWIHFYDNNIDTVSMAYVRTVAPDMELKARFGSVDARGQIKEIKKEYEAIINAEANPKKKLKLARQMEKEIEILENLIKRHRNIYENPADHAGITALRVARTANVLAQGGGFMISSIPDLGMVVMRNGLWRTFKTGIVPLVTHFKAVKLSAEEAKLMGVGLEMTETRFGAMADMGDEFARNKLERWSQRLTRNFMMWNLLAPWNTVMKRWTGVITQTRMIEAIQKMQRGMASKSDIEDLFQVGIGEEMAKKINAMLEGPNGMRSEGPVKWAQTMEWEDLRAREAFSAGLRNAVDQTIVTPGLADRPLFMSTELGKTVTQYKSFAIAATQRVMLTGLQKRNMATLNGVAIMMSLGLGVEAMKNIQAGRKLPEDPYDMITAALDRSGTIGIFADAFNIAERTGVLPVKGPLSNRYAARNTTSAILGPTLGLGESAMRLAISAGTGEFSRSETRVARRLIPWQNLFYFRKLFDVAEEGINRSLGIPKRSKR